MKTRVSREYFSDKMRLWEKTMSGADILNQKCREMRLLWWVRAKSKTKSRFPQMPHNRESVVGHFFRNDGGTNRVGALASHPKAKSYEKDANLKIRHSNGLMNRVD